MPDSIFQWMRESECKIIAVTLDLEKHCQKYNRPAHPVAYTLLVMLERFQYLLEETGDTGTAIYEKFNSKMRKKTEIEFKWLNNNSSFPAFSALDNIKGKVRNGDSQKRSNLADV